MFFFCCRRWDSHLSLLYVLNDILTEVYGFSASRKTIWIWISSYLQLYIQLIYGIILLPPSPHFELQEAFEQIFSISPMIVIGSVTSYFVGEMLNATLIAFLKIKFHGRFFALRAIFSTLIASLLRVHFLLILLFMAGYLILVFWK